MEHLIGFHDFTIAVISLITVLVGLNIVFITIYGQTNRILLQDQSIEVVWTLAPVFVLLGITLPSLQRLYLLDDPFRPSLTVKVVGHQWYWSYEYSDYPEASFESFIVPQEEVSGHGRLLESDRSVVFPIRAQVRAVVTGADVIHAWAIPSAGVKVDAGARSVKSGDV